MASGAKDPSKRRVVPIQLEEVAENKDPTMKEISDGVVPPAAIANSYSVHRLVVFAITTSEKCTPLTSRF